MADSLDGETIQDRYRVVAFVKAGGMGEVYRAEDLRLSGAPVAIKRCLWSAFRDPESARRRFIREGRLASRVDHPYVANLREVVEHKGEPLIVMSWVAGPRLRDRLVAGDARPTDILLWMSEVADALSAIHAAGVLHRDLKPENIMIDPTGHVRVLDFGLSKDFAGEHGETITAPGALLGTFAYMSPEQASGDDLGPASDWFALGTILAEGIGGRNPFKQASGSETLRAIRELQAIEADAVRERPALGQLIRRLHAREPQARPSREVAQELRFLWAEELLDKRRAGGSLPARPDGSSASGEAPTAPSIGSPATDSAELARRAHLYARDLDLPQALAWIDRALAADPGFLPGHIARAELLDRLGYGRLAREVAIGAIRRTRRDPSTAAESCLRAEIAYALVFDDLPREISLRRALAARPDAPAEASLDLGEALLRANDWPGALAAFDRAMSLDPSDPRAHLGRARALLNLGDRAWSEALAEAERRFALFASAAGLASCLLVRGRDAYSRSAFEPAGAFYHDAAVQFERANQPARVAVALRAEANMALARGERSQVADLYRRAIALARQVGDRRQLIELLDAKGKLAIYRRDLATARALFREAIADARDAAHARLLLEPLLDLAALENHAGEWDAALLLADEALEVARHAAIAAQVVNAAAQIALAELGLGRLLSARRMADEALERSERNGNADDRAFTLGVGVRIAAVDGRLVDAWKLSEREVELARNEQLEERLAYALLRRARLSIELSDPDAAQTDVEAALALAATGGEAAGEFEARSAAILALASALRGDLAVARGHAAHALAMAAKVGLADLAAEATLLFAALRLWAGEADAAAAMAEQVANEPRADAAVRRLAAVVMSHAVRRPPSDPPEGSPTTRAPGPLDEAHRRYAALLHGSGDADEARRALVTYLLGIPPDLRARVARRPDVVPLVRDLRPVTIPI